MTHGDRRRRIESICEAALAVPPHDRNAFIATRCDGDPSLEGEVRALIAHARTADEFLGDGIDAVAAQVLTTTTGSLVGRRLGVYQITAFIGAGGMGEVYRARDSRLGRDVATKILPASFSNDRERLARFEREARVLAALNDPHIASIYGVEDVDGATVLVLELVTGETLADRIASGPIPLREALSIAQQIAEALEAAHDKGIVHRDLKPANVAVTKEGHIKVLDFGLAKATEPSSGDASQSPTLTHTAARDGVLLGTAAYMSPEQARGQTVDKRTDIWAFGCVLYEMLTGRMAFAGTTVSDYIAAILERDPDWTVLPKAMPPGLRRLLRRCLEKDPKRRVHDIADARIQIDDLLAGAPEESAEAPLYPPRPRRPRVVPWVVAGALAVALALVLWTPGRTVPPVEPLRLSAELSPDVSLAGSAFGPAAILSPNGAVVAFVGQTAASGRPRLYVRRLNELQATPLSGTDGANTPFFSPDGQWIGFFADSKLKKIATRGGAAVTLADAPGNRGGAWGEDDTIVFTPGPPLDLSLRRVSSAGGKSEALTSLADGEVTQRWPQVLPNAKGVLYTSSHNLDTYDDATLAVQPLPTGPPKAVLRGGSQGRYLPGGHLVYIRHGTLFAVPFDLNRLEVTGPPVPAVDGVMSNATTGSAQFAMSASGTLVYLPGPSTGAGLPVDWLDHDGKMTPLRATPANWFDLHFSPDGRRLAIAIVEGQSDIWLYEWARDMLTRLTSDPTNAEGPVWTPDGRRITFASARADTSTFNLYWQRADGTGAAQRLTESQNQQYPGSWHPSGRFLAFYEQNPKTSWDLMILPIEGDEVSGWKPGKPVAFVDSPASEQGPMFSPDGRWLAYTSDETGRPEVYVRPFPGPGSKTLISSDGGTYPTWSHAKHELLYGTLDRRIMVATYSVEGDTFRAEKPRLWSGRSVTNRPWRSFDMHPDGERLAIGLDVQTSGGAKQDKVVFIFNFFDELRRIAPSKK